MHDPDIMRLLETEDFIASFLKEEGFEVFLHDTGMHVLTNRGSDAPFVNVRVKGTHVFLYERSWDLHDPKSLDDLTEKLSDCLFHMTKGKGCDFCPFNHCKPLE